MVNETVTSDPSILSQKIDEALETPEVKIVTIAPSDSEVTLPGGFIAGDGSLVKYAEVRELNGVDEEAIAKAGSVGKALMIMLQRGVVSIGTEKATKEDIDSLLSGDRDTLLLGIRRMTFGDTISFSFACPHCKTDLDVEVDLTKDVPIKDLKDPIEDRTFIYESKKHGNIVVSLPTGLTQKKLLDNTERNVAEVNTILLAGCVESINGEPSIGASSVLKLGMADRERIIMEILNRAPGPRLGEVATTCEACGGEIPMPLTLSELFRL